MCWIIKNKALILVLMNFFVANLMFGQSVRTEQQIRLENPNDKSKYLLLSAPTNLNAILNFQLPPTGGSEGQVLTTDGNGGLSWEAPATPTLTVSTITSTPTTLDGNYDIYIIQITSLASITLPSAASNSGKTITIKARPYPYNNYQYNIIPQSGENLDYSTSSRPIFTNPTSGNFLRGITVNSDGSNWRIISTINY